jgi:enoyl-CoA hydratase/carnithine racemase
MTEVPPSDVPAAPPPEQKVLFETKSGGRIAVITINNPNKMNAMNIDMAKAIVGYLKEADASPKVKCVIIKSAGEKIFTAGWDLSMFKVFTDQLKEDLLNYGSEVSRTIFFLKKPVIVQLQGSAIGAGCIISLAADFRFVAKKEGVVFSLPELELNIPGATGPTVNSTAILGLARSKLMMLGCEKVSLEQMDKWGFITKVCEPAELEDDVKKFARSLIEKSGTLLATQKAMHNIIGAGMMKQYYDMENEVANFFFEKKGTETPEELDTFVTNLWSKYGSGKP